MAKSMYVQGDFLQVSLIESGMYAAANPPFWYASCNHSCGYSEKCPFDAATQCLEEELRRLNVSEGAKEKGFSFEVHYRDEFLPVPCINTKDRPNGLPRVESPYLPVAFDTETERFSAGYMVPKVVCMSWATGLEAYQKTGIETHADGTLNPAVYALFTNDAASIPKVGHNISYDLAVLMAMRPDLITTIFQQAETGVLHCTRIREKLLQLCSTGDLGWMSMPDGSRVKLEYSLAAIGARRLSKNRAAQKENNDSWRKNFAVLDGIPVAEWPAEARDYAIEDSTDTLEIWRQQENERREMITTRGIDPFEQEPFRVALSLSLMLLGAWGAHVDPVRWAEVVEEVEAELTPEKLSLLLSSGILRPGEPPRPYSKGTKNADGTPKMTDAVPPSIDTKKLKAHVEELAKQFPEDFEIKMTEPSKKFPEGQISTDGEWLEAHAQYSPILMQYKARSEVLKLATVEIPKMCVRDWEEKPIKGQVSPIVHTSYDPLVSTGRTSSFGSEGIPSWNSQQVPPKMRPCIVPPEGYVLFSIDYSFMELCTWAQTCYDLLGFSDLMEKINAGYDPHAFLGAQLAYALDGGFRGFADTSKSNAGGATQEGILEVFQAFKQCGVPEYLAFYKKYRTFAKPTGLGYPGGLAARTFIAYAHATYGIEVDLDLAKQLREVWMATFREAEPYFDHIKNNLADPWNAPRTVEKPGKEPKQVKLFAYSTRMGFYRAGADFCATANGMGLQSPSACGATLGVYDCTVACIDPLRGNPILLPDAKGVQARPIYFIHDELFGIVRNDGKAHDRVEAFARLMERSMQIVCPNVKIKCQPVLMNRWYKEAEPVFDGDGRLIPWEPRPASKA